MSQRLNHNTIHKLVDWFVEIRLITPEQAKQAQYDSVKIGGNVVQILLNKGLITKRHVAAGIAQFLEREFIEGLVDLNIDPETLACIDADTARKYMIMPVRTVGHNLVVAFYDPECLDRLSALDLMFDMNIQVVVATEDDILAALDKYYPQVEHISHPTEA